MNKQTTGQSRRPDVGLSEAIIRELNKETVKAVAFAEVGANGNSEYLCLICGEADNSWTISGHFGFEVFGKRYTRDVDIEVVEERSPFLRHFLGTSRETTIRRNFTFDEGRWLHLSAGLGNHFFIRTELFDAFKGVMAERHSTDICRDGIAAAVETVRRGAAAAATESTGKSK